MLAGVRGHDYGRDTPENIARKIRADGWEAAQVAVQRLITGYESFDAIDVEVVDKIDAAFKKENLVPAVLGFYVDPANPDKERRMRSVDLFKKGLDLSLHLSKAYVASETGGFRGTEEERRPLFELLVDSVLRIAEHAEKIGANFAIEPATVHTLGKIDLVCELLERVNSKQMRIVFDAANMLCAEAFADQKTYWNKIFDAFGEKIVIYHMKDAVYAPDHPWGYEPRILGQGQIDFETIFTYLNKHHPDIAVLREEANPQNAALELAFMKECMRKY